MFGRKTKQAVEQGRTRRATVEQPNRPAFSYYSSGRPDVQVRQQSGRQMAPATQPDRRPRIRLQWAQLPFWLLLIVVGVCVVKLLLLSTNPKVIVVNATGTASSYAQPTGVYAQAARSLLASSIMNRTKLTANINGTTSALQQEFPELQTVSLAMPLIGNRPLLYIQLAKPSTILQTPQGSYALNANGVVLTKLQSVPANVPTLTDQADQPTVGHQVLPRSTIQTIQTVNYELTSAKYTVSTFVQPSASPYELDAHIAGQTYTLRFNLQTDALEQSGAVIAALQHLGGTHPKQYLDVRTPERVYYK